VLVNLGATPAEFPVPEGARLRLAWSQPERDGDTLRLGPDEVAVVQL
jgi:hypothetical protein